MTTLIIYFRWANGECDIMVYRGVLPLDMVVEKLSETPEFYLAWRLL